MTLSIQNLDLIGPVLAQALLGIILMFVLYSRRIPAIKNTRLSNEQMQDKNGLNKLPAPARFAAENYNHQFEAPVLFYVISICAMLAGIDNGLTLVFAWLYVGLRVVHSIIHVTYNKVIHRFAVFSLSNFALIGLFLTVAYEYLT